MTPQELYKKQAVHKKYVARIKKQYPNEKAWLDFDQWLPLYEAGLAS
jgi:hypothetical protein